jgi:hypothetical protein
MGPSSIGRLFLASWLLWSGSTSLPGQSIPAAAGPTPSLQAIPRDPQSRLEALAGLNGPDKSGSQAWHIKIAYDHFDSDGDNDSSGNYEEWWASPNKYKRIYSSENSTQTEVASRAGLFLSGALKWPGLVETDVRQTITEPLHRAAMALGSDTAYDRSEWRSGNETLPCIALRKPDLTLTMNFEVGFPKYCFGPDLPIVRYSSGLGMETFYESIGTHEGRYVAKAAKVIRGGRAYLDIQVEELETITQIEAADFAAPADAVRVSEPVEIPSGELWDYIVKQPSYDRLSQVAGTGVVQLLIGKDGRVKDAKGIRGPANLQKAGEKAARTIEFRPFLVLGAPVEVKTDWDIEFK